LLGVQRTFARISPNLPEKLLCDKLSLYKFSVIVGTFYFPLLCCHRLDYINLVLEVWFLITQLNKSKKYAGLCKNIVAQYSEHLLHVCEDWRSIRIPTVAANNKPHN